MEEPLIIEPKKSLFKRILKIFFWTISMIIFLCIVAVSLVFVYEDEVKGVVIKELNKNLRTEVRIDPKNIDLTFISSFPMCAIEFKELCAMETWNKKERDTLLFAERLSLQFSIKDIFNKHYTIQKIYLSGANCSLKEDKNGITNYEVWKTKDTTTTSNNDSLNFQLKAIVLENVKVSYKDKARLVKTSFTINDLLFSGNFSEDEYEMTAKGSMDVSSLSVNKMNYLTNKHINSDVELLVNGNNYEIRHSDIAINKMQFGTTGSFIFKDSLQTLDVKYNAKKLDIASILSLLPEKHRSRINDYSSTGEFYASGHIKYSLNKQTSISSDFGIKNATIEYDPQKTKLNDVNLSGTLIMDDKKTSLSLPQINASLNGDKFTGQFTMDDFDDPKLFISANGTFNLSQVNAFWPIDTLEKLEGTIHFNGEVSGPLKDLKQSGFTEQIKIDLTAEVNNLKTKFKNDFRELSVESCKIKAVERDIRVEHLKLKRGNSDVDLTGEVPGLINYILDKNAPLIIVGKLSSNNIDLDDFVFATSDNTQNASELIVPSNVSLQLDASVKDFSFKKFKAVNISGNFELKKAKAMISEMHFETMEGSAEANALFDASGKDLEVTLQSKIKNINVNKLFIQLNNFGQSTLTDKNVNGYVTADIEFAGNWDKLLNPILKTIRATTALNIERGELNDFKPLESLSDFVELKELQRIKFSSLTSNIEIKDNTIFIPQTTIKNSALNIDFNGTHDFNNNIDYHIRLLISELMAKKRKNNNDEFGPVENDPENKRCAFISMTGNIDNISVKYDRKGMAQKIKEDIKQEKQNLKQILKDEFGIFKNDTIKTKTHKKSDQKFELEKSDNNNPKKALEPKKKKDDEDDGDF